MSQLEDEAIRLFRRYAIEVVERFGLCPWAEPARRAGHVVERALSGPGAIDRCLAVIDECGARPEVEILLLIFPGLALDVRAFERFAALLREADAKRHPLGEIPFAMAAFHPDAPADLGDAERLIPYLRRTPDPTLQLVRCSVLAKVRGKHPQGTAFVDPEALEFGRMAPPPEDVRERIARLNLETLQKVGLATVEDVLRDILRDRDQSYSRIGRDSTGDGDEPPPVQGRLVPS